MVRITQVEPLSGHRVSLRFTDGSAGVVDLSHLVGRGPFEAWRDETFFRMVAVDPRTKTVCWPGGIDLDPDVLYARAHGLTEPGKAAA